MRPWTELEYDRLAKKAIEKNIGYLINKMSRPGEIDQVDKIGIAKQRLKGTTYNLKKKRWIAQKTIKGKIIYLGSFKAPKDAAKAYEKFMKTLKNVKAIAA